MQDGHPLRAVDQIALASGRTARFCSLPALERLGVGRTSRLPVCLRVVLESLMRNLDGERVREADVRALAGWQPVARRTAEVPFVVARVLLQDFTGVPLVVDLAAMRAAVGRLGHDPAIIEPRVPVDLVVDHSVQVDHAGRPDALTLNMDLELRRNRQRYELLKWGKQAFAGTRIVPPGIGIVHQVDLELLALGVFDEDGMLYPDSVVGTDSHTPMVNGLGVVGWGVGGIEAEAGMLGQPVAFLTPDVVGVHLSGALDPATTATDLVLTVTERLRRKGVVGKFVEFFGEGAATLPVAVRATVANMAPEYGATMGYFPVDEATLRYYAATGRTPEQVDTIRRYHAAQGMLGMPRRGDCDYTDEVELDLGDVRPSVAGPRRPQDRIDLADVGRTFRDLLVAAPPAGYGKSPDEVGRRRDGELGHGDVLIAAITSCTNTSNPRVMLAAGLVARKAVLRGLTVPPFVKTSLAPGSRVVTRYLERTGLQKDLDALGFHLVGYGCTTCIGNSGPLDPRVEEMLARGDVIGASVLSGNRNFEARVHQSLKANFLMSPPLVVAFAIAGRVDLDLTRDPLGSDRDGKPVFLRDLWPAPSEIEALLETAEDPELYRTMYAPAAMKNEAWDRLVAAQGTLYDFSPDSTYVKEPPYFEAFALEPPPLRPVRGARALAIFGDSVTTDHISPAGSIKPDSPAGRYLLDAGVGQADFNSYGSRRGNHEVMVRGTFANVRIRNRMVPGVEGGMTKHQPTGQVMSIFDASQRYRETGTPLVVIAGLEYGTGSSRDWAAKGPKLLGVEAVVARSFERIHRANLVGMGILPCELPEGVSAESLGLTGTERFTIEGASDDLAPLQQARLRVEREGGDVLEVPVTVRIDTPIEVQYFRHGGILPFVLRQQLRLAGTQRGH